MPKEHKEWMRFFRFAIVGASGAVVDFGILNLLTLVFKIAYVPSSVVSFVMAVLNNFLWNRFWTYPDSRSKHVAKQLIQFVIINVIGLAIRTPLLAFLEGVLIKLFTNILPKGFFLTPAFVGHNIGLAIAILVVMLWNYIANRYWTYNDVK
jgi:putative flippase GtrA